MKDIQEAEFHVFIYIGNGEMRLSRELNRYFKNRTEINSNFTSEYQGSKEMQTKTSIFYHHRLMSAFFHSRVGREAIWGGENIFATPLRVTGQ